jgi:hypothetical protein
MKVVEKGTISIRKCPDNHTEGVIEIMLLGVSWQRHCTTCGKELVDGTEEISAENEICMSCGKPSSDIWEHCPWCGKTER